MAATPPVPPSGDLTGSQFAQTIMSLSGSARENAIESALAAGKYPEFLRTLVPVTLPGTPAITIYVMPDFVGVGVDSDWLRTPMYPTTAQRVADAMGASLPTKKMADAIQAAAVHVKMPYFANNKDASTTYIAANSSANNRLAAAGAAQGRLVDGHKKNVLVADSAHPGKVVIYGGNNPDTGAWPVQPVSTVHSSSYVDYGHGIRLVSRHVDVAGRGPLFLADVMSDPQLAPLVSATTERNTRYSR